MSDDVAKKSASNLDNKIPFWQTEHTRNRPRVHVLNTLHADNQPNHQLTTFKWSPRDEVGDDEDFVCPAKLPLGDSKRN